MTKSPRSPVRGGSMTLAGITPVAALFAARGIASGQFKSPSKKISPKKKFRVSPKKKYRFSPKKKMSLKKKKVSPKKKTSPKKKSPKKSPKRV